MLGKSGLILAVVLVFSSSAALGAVPEDLQREIETIDACIEAADDPCLLEVGLRLAVDPDLRGAIAERYAEAGNRRMAGEIFQETFETIAYSEMQGPLVDGRLEQLSNLARRQYRTGFERQARRSLQTLHEYLDEGAASGIRPRIRNGYRGAGAPPPLSLSELQDAPFPAVFEGPEDASCGRRGFLGDSVRGSVGVEGHQNWYGIAWLQHQMGWSRDAVETLDSYVDLALPRTMESDAHWGYGLPGTMLEYILSYEEFGNRRRAREVAHLWLDLLLRYERICDTIAYSSQFAEYGFHLVDEEDQDKLRRHVAIFLANPNERETTVPVIEDLVWILSSEQRNPDIRLLEGNPFLHQINIKVGQQPTHQFLTDDHFIIAGHRRQNMGCGPQGVVDCLYRNVLMAQPTLTLDSGLQENGVSRRYTRSIHLQLLLEMAATFEDTPVSAGITRVYLRQKTEEYEATNARHPETQSTRRWSRNLDPWMFELYRLAHFSDQLNAMKADESAALVWEYVENTIETWPEVCGGGHTFISARYLREGDHAEAMEWLEVVDPIVRERLRTSSQIVRNSQLCGSYPTENWVILQMANLNGNLGREDHQDEILEEFVDHCCSQGTGDRFTGMRIANSLVFHGHEEAGRRFLRNLLVRVQDEYGSLDTLDNEEWVEIVAQIAVLGASFNIENPEMVSGWKVRRFTSTDPHEFLREEMPTEWYISGWDIVPGF